MLAALKISGNNVLLLITVFLVDCENMLVITKKYKYSSLWNASFINVVVAKKKVSVKTKQNSRKVRGTLYYFAKKPKTICYFTVKYILGIRI